MSLANCAAEGPTTLHMHDADRSVAGLALARSRPLQASMLGGAASQAVMAELTDVALMLAEAPNVAHLLCVPFSSTAEDVPEAAVGSAAGPACPLHAKGGSSGALLIGFSAAAPQLSDWRKAALLALARCLPTLMARLSADALAFVAFATGSGACSCCCDANARANADPSALECCSQPDSNSKGGDSDAGTPFQALAVLPLSQSGTEGDSPDSNVSTLRLGKPRSAAGTAAQTDAKPAPAQPAAMAQRSADRPSPSPGPPASPGFSKALVGEVAAAVAAGDGEGLLALSPLSLCFASDLAEREYRRWMVPLYRRIDRTASLLMLAAMVVVALFQVWVFKRGAELLDCCCRVPAVCDCSTSFARSHLPSPRPTALTSALPPAAHRSAHAGAGGRDSTAPGLHFPGPGALCRLALRFRGRLPLVRRRVCQLGGHPRPADLLAAGAGQSLGRAVALERRRVPDCLGHRLPPAAAAALACASCGAGHCGLQLSADVHTGAMCVLEVGWDALWVAPQVSCDGSPPNATTTTPTTALQSPDLCPASCVYCSVAFAALLGLLVPTAVTRYMERRSRTTFCRLLCSPAAAQ